MNLRNNEKKKEMTTRYQYHVGTREGFKIEMTCSLTLLTPTIHFRLSFVISNVVTCLGS